ncbi:A-agglutinin anchorage subunit-like [Centruroides sculpturatus]|uniref:A-agglutinin anchorage subunit-like n=1 Tax=Centruroides sculpturatus TaxID=218467 RepID=UPI000C6D9BF5|nr:A-agglutinin anchorage subunit-like [Centruroides sculpturatus]
MMLLHSIKCPIAFYIVYCIFYRVQCQTVVDIVNLTEAEMEGQTQIITSTLSPVENVSTVTLTETTSIANEDKEDTVHNTSVSEMSTGSASDGVSIENLESTKAVTKPATLIEMTTPMETALTEATKPATTVPTTTTTTTTFRPHTTMATSTQSPTISPEIDSEESTETEELLVTTYLPLVSTWKTSTLTSLSPSTELQPEESNNSLNITQFSVNECSFAGEKLDCDVWIKCFGEGEVDCTESEERSIPDPEELDSKSFYVRNHYNEERPCKISGTLQCIPQPLMPKCKGSGKCKLVSLELAVEEGMEDWIIAVICISIGLGCFLLIVLGYVIYTSWKKLRVQPQTSASTSYVTGQTA